MSGIIGRTDPDPGKLPVILCHGLGLNATFWTITEFHLPAQLNARGYEVYVFDIRGSGENAQIGRHDRVNTLLRQTFLKERGERCWTVDDLVRFDMPAILELRQTRDWPISGQLGGTQPGWNARLPLPGAQPRSGADRQFRRHGQHNHPGEIPAMGYAPR